MPEENEKWRVTLGPLEGEVLRLAALAQDDYPLRIASLKVERWNVEEKGKSRFLTAVLATSFLRTLYRQGRLTPAELDARLRALKDLAAKGPTLA